MIQKDFIILFSLKTYMKNYVNSCKLLVKNRSKSNKIVCGIRLEGEKTCTQM